MLFYPIVNDSSFLEPHTQLNKEAAGFRFDLRAAQDFGCVDSSFLTTMIRDFNKAIRKVNNRKKVLEGICALQEVTLFSLDPDDNDPYQIGFCPNDVGGNLSSRLLALTWQAHRGVRFPDDDVPFQNDPRILCELPRLQGDPLLTCPTTELSPQCAAL